ncbi:hypothetical protein MLD52_00855 [Puniceicoccaceae bacterium K14]|nr:hypothetical protein [Puniceicoccaceae bacterium K14]
MNLSLFPSLKSQICSALVAIVTAVTLNAQPTDEVVLNDMTNPTIISVKLTPKNGQKQWNSDYGIWEYVRGVEAIKKYPKDENVTIKILGDAVYQMYGETDYKYWKFRVISNEYLGMDAPSSEDLMAIVESDLPKFLSPYWYNRIIGELGSLYIADDPKFTWHTTNSMSFNVVAEYRARTSDIHVEDIVQPITVRLYRENEESEWNNFISTRGQQKSLNRAEYSRDEVKSMKTLAFLVEEKKAASIEVPDLKFESARDLALALSDKLVNGTPEEVEVFLLATLAPMHKVEGSEKQFSPFGQQTVSQLIQEAFTGKSTYREQFCEQPFVDEQRSSSKRVYLSGIGKRAKLQVACQQYGGGYVDGVKQEGSFKITTIQIYMAKKADDMEFFNSFSSRSKACPGE